MNQEVLIERLFQTLINGDRAGARAIVEETIDAGIAAEDLITDVYFPTLNLIHRLHRSDQLSIMAHHFATRLLRSLADQAQTRLDFRPRNGRRVLVACGPTEPDELAAQMASDLVEAGGFEVTYLGGGVPMDEIISRVGEERPDVLLLYSSAACDLPEIRRMIDDLREVNACPEMQIAVGGGVFGRADGLAEEIGADLFIEDIREAVDLLIEFRDQRATADQRTVGRKRRIKAA